MREIMKRATKSMKGSVGRINNRCIHRYDCQKRNCACKYCLHANRSMLCRLCRQCNSHCPNYIEQKVRPWVTEETNPKEDRSATK